MRSFGLGEPAFQDRADAGRQLASLLTPYRDRRPVVLALPRGGVPVAEPVAASLDAPLDLLLVRKIGAPGNPELAVGAVAEVAGHSELFMNEDILDRLGLTSARLQPTVDAELATIRRRRDEYLRGRAPLDLDGRTAIIIDDGIATGASMGIALQIVRARDPAAIVMAVPVAPPSTLERLRPLYEEAVCVLTPEDFYGVGQFYRDFAQTTDEEVLRILNAHADRPAGDAQK